MNRVLAALTLALASVAAAPASAQQRDMGWYSFNISGGCQIVVPARAQMSNDETVTWSGDCRRGRAIDGDGTLRIAWERNKADGEAVAMTLTGRFVGGVPHGTLRSDTLNQSGGVIVTENLTYSMGCPASDTTCTPYEVTSP